MAKRWNKRAIQDYLIWVLIAVFVLVMLVISVLLMKNKGFSLLEQLKDIFRFR